MTNLVKLEGGRVEIPSLDLAYPIAAPAARLDEGLAAYQGLKEDIGLQALALARRRDVTRFLRQFGQLLFHTLFPHNGHSHLDGRQPLLLQTSLDWAVYPWELLYDDVGWVGVRQGVVRYLEPPAAPDDAAELHEDGLRLEDELRIAALNARPLPGGADPRFDAAERRAGARFVSPMRDAAATLAQMPHCLCRAEEHISRAELERALDLGAQFLMFSGYVTADAWYLETARGTPDRVPAKWMQSRLQRAVRGGLRLVLLNDSLGLGDPGAAAAQTGSLLHGGLPAVVRVEGRLARLREQDYLRTLCRQLAAGYGPSSSHLAGVRRLYRRFEEGWDWAFIRLHMRGAPAPQSALRPVAEGSPRPPRGGSSPEPPAPGYPPGRALRTFASVALPPVFRARRRVFGRHGVLLRLVQALQPDPKVTSPLVFLSGPAGSGKTVLAFDLARRTHRGFAQVVYLHPLALLDPELSAGTPDDGEAPPPTPAQRLLRALGRQLGAQGAFDAPPEQWPGTLAGLLNAGPPRLVILDRLELHTGYPALCETLARVSPAHRILVLSRGKPPVLAGSWVELPPAGREDLAAIFDAAFVARVCSPPHGEGLLRLCGRDLLLARLLWRLQRWPAPEHPLASAPPAEAAPLAAEGARATDRPPLERVLDLLLAETGAEARRALQVLVCFPHLAAHEMLAQLVLLDEQTLHRALSELQWTGLVESFEADGYLRVPPRLQRAIAERLVTQADWERLRPELVLAYRAWLAAAGRSQGSGGGEHAAAPPSPWAWEDDSRAPPEPLARAHRLGVEAANLAEFAATLADEQEWSALEALGGEGAWLADEPALRDVARLLHRLMLRAGGARRDAVVQARALNLLARPLVRSSRPARAQRLLEQALDLLGTAPDWELLAQTYFQLSTCYEALHRPEPAANLLQAGLELAQQTGNHDNLIESLRRLSRVWRVRSDGLEQAERLISSRLHELERRGAPLHAARARLLLAENHLAQHRLAEAERAYREAATQLREARAWDDLHAALLGLAQVQLARGEPERARTLLGRVAELPPGSGNWREEARLLGAVAQHYRQAGNLPSALQGYLRLQHLHAAMGDREGLVAALDVLGGLYYQMGEQSKSTECYQERLQLMESPAR